jgi:hypothetical protein
MKSFISKSIVVFSLIAHAAMAQYGTKGSAIDFVSNESYTDGFISDFYKSNNLSVQLSCGSYEEHIGNGNLLKRGTFTSIASNGNLLNSKRYKIFNDGFPTELVTELNSICEVNATGLFQTGTVYLPPNNTRAVLLMKTDQNGNPQKINKIILGGGDEGTCTSRSRRFSNVFYTCGVSRQAKNKFFLFSHNADGSVINWSKKIELTYGSAEALAVIDEANTGNVIVVGNSYDSNGSAASKRAFIAKFTSAGVLKWVHSIQPSFANQFAELNFQSIRATENAQAFVLTGSAKQRATNRVSTIILRVKTDSDIKPVIEFFNLISLPDNPINPSVKQEGNDVVMQVSGGLIQYFIAATLFLADGNKQAAQIRCSANGTALQAKTFNNLTHATFTAIDLVQNDASGNGIACFGSQKTVFAANGAPTQKGMLIKSTSALATACNDVSLTPSNLGLNASAINETSITENSILIRVELTHSIIAGQVYATCWSSGQAGSARYDERYESETALDPTQNSEIIASPNPTQGNTALAFYTSSAQHISLAIYDVRGSLVYSKPVDTNEGQNTIDLDLIALNPGLYLDMLSAEGYEGKSVRIIKN